MLFVHRRRPECFVGIKQKRCNTFRPSVYCGKRRIPHITFETSNVTAMNVAIQAEKALGPVSKTFATSGLPLHATPRFCGSLLRTQHAEDNKTLKKLPRTSRNATQLRSSIENRIRKFHARAGRARRRSPCRVGHCRQRCDGSAVS